MNVSVRTARQDSIPYLLTVTLPNLGIVSNKVDQPRVLQGLAAYTGKRIGQLKRCHVESGERRGQACLSRYVNYYPSLIGQSLGYAKFPVVESKWI